MKLCSIHNYYHLGDECPKCESGGLSLLDSSSNNSYGFGSSNSIFGKEKSYLEKMMERLDENKALSYDPPKSLLPELKPPVIPNPPRPVNNLLGDRIGYREPDVLGRDTIRPFGNNGYYNVGPTLGGSAYVRDFRGNLVGQLSPGAFGDTLLPPPDFGPSFR